MNLLFRVLYAQKCTGTHHKLAMDALRYLRAGEFEDWSRLFLSEVELYLDGAKAPDRKFKDFRNHVLHVSDNGWGGAISAAETWYARLVEQLKLNDWPRAVYSAGVLSHYVTDPLMPLHTGQTEDEGQVHKFIEWGTSKIYQDLVNTHATARALQNWKPAENRSSEDWLACVIMQGARSAHEDYDILIDHYDPAIGQNTPTAGFDDTCRTSLSRLLGISIKTLAYIIDQSIIESGAQAPRRSITVSTVLSGMSTPLFWVTRKLADRKDRAVVKKIWEELQATGKVINALPEDDQTIRAAHADEVLKISLDELNRTPVRKAGSKHKAPLDPTAQPKSKTEVFRPKVLRFYLELDSPVVEAPSIGPKTAERLQQIEINTVEELLDANADDATDQLDQSWISIDVFRKWQQQSTLMCRVPGLRGHDAQLLVEVGITRPEELRGADPRELLRLVIELAGSTNGKGILRSSDAPNIVEVKYWIQLAEKSRTLRAA